MAKKAQEAQEAPRRPSVVYDLKMPVYGYRDDSGQSRTLDIDRPKIEGLKLNCLSNLSKSVGVERVRGIEPL